MVPRLVGVTGPTVCSHFRDNILGDRGDLHANSSYNSDPRTVDVYEVHAESNLHVLRHAQQKLNLILILIPERSLVIRDSREVTHSFKV